MAGSVPPISRRQFLSSAAALAGAAAAGNVLLRGSSAEAVTRSRLAQHEELKGGRSGPLSIGFVGTLTSLTPIGIQTTWWSQMMGSMLYDPLVNHNAKGQLVPAAAESWDISSPTETVINVRPGMHFHNGQPVTAQDVAYSIAVRSDPKLIAKTSGRPIMTTKLWVSATVVGTHKVVIKTTKRVRGILEYPQPVLVIPNNAHTKSNLATTDVGSGPFMLKQFLSGSSLSMVPNPHHWAGQPKIHPTIKFFGNISSEALALRSGGIDAIVNLLPLDVSNVQGVPHKRMVTFSYFETWWITQMGKPPLDNPAVRNALGYAFNMPLINQSAFGGKGVHPWNPFLFYPEKYHASIKPPWSYNPEKAKALLAKAGVKRPLTVPIIGFVTTLASILSGEIIQQGFQAAGVNAHFSTLTITAWLQKTYTNGTWEGITQNSGTPPFPYLTMWTYLVFPDAILSAYNKNPDPIAAKLYTQIEAAPTSEMVRLIKQAQKVLFKNVPCYFMFGAPAKLVLPTNLHGVGTNGYGTVWWNKASFS